MARWQQRFRDWTTGTLLYVLVLGFFDDYTSVLAVPSHSTLVLVAAVLQVLTMATMWVKKSVRARLTRPGDDTRIGALVAAVWAILFVSKFVFLGVLDLVFGTSVEVSGFVGLTAIVASTVVVAAVLDRIDAALGERGGGDRPGT